MSRAVDDLLAVLDLEQRENNLFRGRSPQVGWQRVFGGQVIGPGARRSLPDGRCADLPPPVAPCLFPARRRPKSADYLRGRPNP